MENLEEKIIIEANKMRNENLSFRKIAELLNIDLQKAIHYCTNSKYSKYLKISAVG